MRKETKAKKSFYKEWWFIVPMVIIVVAIIAASAMPIYKLISTPSYNYEELDVSELSINEACQRVKSEGWSIDEISNQWDDGDRKLDCYNTKYIVYSFEYNDTEKNVTFVYTVPRLDDAELLNQPISVVCKKLKDAGWRVRDPRTDTPMNHLLASSCNGNEPVTELVYTDEYLSVQPYITSDDIIDEYPLSSSNSTNNGSSSSLSSSNSASSNTSTSNSSFRNVMDSYESFMNKYVDFMKKYKNSSDTASMLSDYSEMMKDYQKYADSISGYNQSNLSADDWAYYLDVTTRVNKKLLEI